MLRGERIVLREFRRDDQEAIQRWVNNENMNSNEGVFVTALKDDPKLEYIGAVGLHNIDYRNRHCELGIVIGREDLLGKGIGREAIQLVLGFAFNFLNMHKVNLRVFEYNERGRRCYLKCGFKEEGRIREQRFYDGRYWDEIIMGITRDEFRRSCDPACCGGNGGL